MKGRLTNLVNFLSICQTSHTFQCIYFFTYIYIFLEKVVRKIASETEASEDSWRKREIKIIQNKICYFKQEEEAVTNVTLIYTF